jgi:hypothetical protein|mmetsp:Transcript_20253/g.27380  ORF Transcript_20253/g.27380 Transcript_20253/m.27380 type:complete len:144 (+) Transcript_20253:526-957(+)
MNGMGESSMFSLFAPVEDDLTSDQAKTQTAPKLNAQTLFAFGADTFSSAFSDSKNRGFGANQSAPAKVQVNPWSLTSDFKPSQPAQMAQGMLGVSMSDVPPFMANRQGGHSVDSKNGLLTEEIFASALNNARADSEGNALESP